MPAPLPTAGAAAAVPLPGRLNTLLQRRPNPSPFSLSATRSPLAGQGLPRLETQKVFVSPYLDRLLKGRAA